MGIRTDNPELWADMVKAARETVGDWTEDEIANVMNKVRAPSADLVLDHIGHVLAWCAAAQKSDDEDAQACVELWQMDGLPIEITVGLDGRVSHRLEPDIEVVMEPADEPADG